MGSDENQNKDRIQEEYGRYANILKAIFEPINENLFEYAFTLLRVGGLEDQGWDPMMESREIFDDINILTQMDLEKEEFKEPEKTKWRFGLLGYVHLIEMDAPYNLIANLLRVAVGKKYLWDPFWHIGERKVKGKKHDYLRKGPPAIYPTEKITEIKKLAKEAKVSEIGNIFKEFYSSSLRNCINHSDYILHEEEFRIGKGKIFLEAENTYTSKISLGKISDILTKAYAFYWAFFELEKHARQCFGSHRSKCYPFDYKHKGLMEFLIDNENLLNGFKVHWPNKLDSFFKRDSEGCTCSNIHLEKDLSVNFFVGEFFRNHSPFSSLVPLNGQPEYSPMENSKIPSWPN